MGKSRSGILQHWVELNKNFNMDVANAWFLTRMSVHLNSRLFIKYSFAFKDKVIKRELKQILSDCKVPNSGLNAKNGDLDSSMPIKNVWFFWWQGEANMPEIVRNNLERDFSIFGKQRVHLIDKYNLADYLNISKPVQAKFESGLISLAHLSDIVRFGLLSEYGGIWVDSTILFLRFPRDLKDSQNAFYTGKGYVNNDKAFFYQNPSHFRWTIYFLCLPKNSPIALTIYKYLNVYWSQENYQIDYFLIDYLMDYALTQVPSSETDDFLSLKDSSVEKEHFNDYLNDESSSTLNLIMNSTTDYIKMSLRHSYELHNVNSIYYKIISEGETR